MSFTDVRNIHVKGSITFLTCGVDGTVYVWDEKTVVQREVPEIKTVGDATHSCCAWNGKNVFVGLTTTDLLTGVDKKIVGQCSLDDLETDFTVKKVCLKDYASYDRLDMNAEVLSVAIDPKEEVYAVACCDGSVSIFNIASNEKLRSLDNMFAQFGDVGSVLSQFVYDKRSKNAIISCTKFCPFNENDIILVDIEEGMCLLKNVIPSTTRESAPINETTDRKEIDGVDEDEESNEEGAENSHAGSFLDNEAEDDGDTKMSVDIGAIKRKYGFGDDGSGNLEDYGFTRLDEPPSGRLPSAGHDFHNIAPSVPPPQIVSYQPPAIPSFFVSGSSPDHLTQRYLKWNGYGIVRTYSGEEGSSIEITFHDATIHPTIVLDNGTTGYVLADLSDQAVALASKAEEKGEQSELLVIHISSWDSESRRWSTKLPPKECALDVLVSREVICVVTTLRHLRVFTLTGTQRHVIVHPSPILTAACFGTRIAICSVSGGDYYEKEKKNQHPSYQHTVSIYDVDSKQWHRSSGSGVNHVDLPVARKQHLRWLAFSNHGQLVSMDSSFTVSLLTPSGFWIPIFNGNSETMNKSDAIWPIAVVDGRQRQIRYLHCKGSNYPLIAVKMAPLIAPWALPYCAPESDKSKLEQELFFNELQQSEARTTSASSDLVELASSHLQSLIKLFALACKSERDGRAAELAGLVTSAKGIQLMCNYAAKLKKFTLAEKIFMEENSATTAMASMKPDIDDYEDGHADFQQPSCTQQTDDTLLDRTLIPARKISRNPFKRSPTSSLDTSSVFDSDFSLSSNRKRMKEEEPPKPSTSTSKQKKLSIGAFMKDKENARTAYTLWMESNEETLRDSLRSEEVYAKAYEALS
ncbi:unnamed protein product [Haemonchus placei]|uniref:Mcl1_mid domain-containing protein n=1 Tax=Haemonchus placei TaxID=6290 RepID=A0A158QKV5_HAEPC|nr:unnamed protein product [Haemonchus placei]